MIREGGGRSMGFEFALSDEATLLSLTPSKIEISLWLFASLPLSSVVCLPKHSTSPLSGLSSTMYKPVGVPSVASDKASATLGSI